MRPKQGLTRRSRLAQRLYLIGMLRQKLLLVLGSVIALVLVAGVTAVLLLQSVLSDFEHLGGEAIAGASTAMALQMRLTDLQGEVERAAAQATPGDAGRIASAMSDIRQQLDGLRDLEIIRGPAAKQYSELRTLIDEVSQAARPALNADGREAPAHAATAYQPLLEKVGAARVQLIALRETMRSHAEIEERGMVSRFRWIVLGLGLAFVLVINGSIMVLARMSSMILKPVDRLVEASRRLAREEFDHRIEIDRKDEFGELAAAHNNLAAQLQANEQRKIETLHQVARTLSHELNNAMAIIQLQLNLASRAAAGSDGLQPERLREIQEALTRMAATVSALTRVRRIVLTDYLSGVKMLDLQASVAEE